MITLELQNEILNYRLQNIYSALNSSRQFIFKFALPDSKKVLVIDCGNKLHLTEFERPTSQTPSNFATKLRKHLKSRRLSGIKQIGNDRIVVLQFSDGLFYLVFEFFSAGNILLLDSERKILSLQRVVLGTDEREKFAVNETYKMFDQSLFQTSLSLELIRFENETIKSWIVSHKDKILNSTNDKKKSKVFSIHKLIFANASYLSSDLIKHSLIEKGINPSESCFRFLENDGLNEITDAVNEAEKFYYYLLTTSEMKKGFIVLKKNPFYNPMEEPDSDLKFVMDEFHPFKPSISASESKIEEVDGYNKTLDKFFSTIESTKYALRVEQQKQQAAKRLESAKDARDQQIRSLNEVQELHKRKGDAIMYYAELIDRCRSTILNLLEQQMDWTNIESLIELEQSRGSEMAALIQMPLNLKEGKIKLELTDIDFNYDPENIETDLLSSNSDDSDYSSSLDSDYSSDSDSSASDTRKTAKSKRSRTAKNRQKEDYRKTLVVEIDIRLSAFANARLYFDSKKLAASKMEKVEQNTGMALKNAKKRIDKDLSKKLKQETESLKQIRNKFWFEKFYWFITSEGYLCLAGKDDSQVDIIYYRHFNDNDCLVSADIDGSLKVFVKNPFEGHPVPPTSLMQAGAFALASSAAWNSKITTSAWVVDGKEISKKNKDGSFVPSGSFNLIAQKNFLPPIQLVMGFGFYWLIDENSALKYRQNRVERENESGLRIVVDNKKKDLEVEYLKSLSQSGADDEVYAETADLNVSAETYPEENNELDLKSQSDSEFKKDVDSLNEPDIDVNSLDESVNDLNLSNSSNPTANSTRKANARGKKAKLKKIARKYADQDEEERRLRMEALGTLKQVEEKQREEQQQSKSQSEKFKRDRKQEDRKRNEEREYKKYIMEEDKESSLSNYLEILDSILPKPNSEDVLVNAIPVFAPWGALSRFKYKVKIQPGTGKKGKCISECLHHFITRKVDVTNSDSEADWTIEHNLIKDVSLNDCIGSFMVSKVKASFSGADKEKSKKAQKKRK